MGTVDLIVLRILIKTNIISRKYIKSELSTFKNIFTNCILSDIKHTEKAKICKYIVSQTQTNI